LGTWGPGLYDNDTASDIRDAFQELYDQNLSGEEIIETIYGNYEDIFKDADEGVIAYLSLCVCLHSVNLLPKDMLEKALDYIDDGADLACWGDCKQELYAARKKELQRVKKMLLRKPVIKKCKKHPIKHYEVGEVYALPITCEKAKEMNLDGEYFILIIVGHEKKVNKYEHPLVYVKVTQNRKLPENADEINALEFVQISSKKASKRFAPYSCAEDMPIQYREGCQSGEPDEWNRLPEYRMSISETNNNHPPESLIFLGIFPDVLPPKNNYIAYKSMLGAAWIYLEEYVLLMYNLHNLRNAEFYKTDGLCDK